MNYDSVFSIGGACEVAHHIRLFTGKDSASLFDWWITPFDGLLKVVESDFEGLLAPENMVALPRRSVTCSRYGIIHHHDFRRDHNRQIVTEEIPSRLIELNSKYSMLVKRFRSAFTGNRKILLVRGWRDDLHEKRNVPDPGTVTHDFRRLIDAIRTRFPEAEISFLFVNYNTAEDLGGGISFDNVTVYDDKVDWRGSTRGWQELLARHISI